MIFVIQNESSRPVWWFVIRVWIIMVLSDDKSYCLVSSHIQHGLNYHSDKLGLTWPVQTAGERSLVVNIYSTMCSKVILCKIPKIWGRPSTTFLNYPRSGIWKIIHPCCWYHHTLYFKSYRIYQARYPVTHVTQAGKLRPGTRARHRRTLERGLKASWVWPVRPG